MSTTQPNRILAVEIRAARLGYAVFETPKALLDFGGASFASSRAARCRIARLLRLYAPSAFVIPSEGLRYPRNMRVRKAVARIARTEAKKRSVPVARLSDQTVRAFFRQYSCRDKYDVAALLATRFPDLAWRLPPRPKFYDPEPGPMLYFDSIALGLAYLERTDENNQISNADGGILSPASK